MNWFRIFVSKHEEWIISNDWIFCVVNDNGQYENNGIAKLQDIKVWILGEAYMDDNDEQNHPNIVVCCQSISQFE